jgi:hypothetical protein
MINAYRGIQEAYVNNVIFLILEAKVNLPFLHHLSAGDVRSKKKILQKKIKLLNF